MGVRWGGGKVGGGGRVGEGGGVVGDEELLVPIYFFVYVSTTTAPSLVRVRIP